MSNHGLVSVPRLTNNPSRVDRLIVDALREYNKTWSLISKMENSALKIFFEKIHMSFKDWLEKINIVKARRKEELENNYMRDKMGQPTKSYDDTGNKIETFIKRFK